MYNLKGSEEWLNMNLSYNLGMKDTIYDPVYEVQKYLVVDRDYDGPDEICDVVQESTFEVVLDVAESAE